MTVDGGPGGDHGRGGDDEEIGDNGERCEIEVDEDN